MPHAIWKGHISFGLVSIPIVLYPSENRSANISFRQIDKRDNAPIKYQRINAETGKEVPWSEITKGYEYAKGEILPVKSGELEKVAGDNAKVIEIESFIDKSEIDYINVERTFYLAPDKKGDKGYVILREALNDSKKIGIAKVIISTKEYLAAVATYENAIVLYTLHYNDEIRQPDEFDLPTENLKQYKVTEKEIEIAKQLIHSMTSKWRPENYKDEYREAVQNWVDDKLNNHPMTKMKKRGVAAPKGNVVNFVDLLKKSLQAKPAKRASKSTRARSQKKLTVVTKRSAKTKNGRHATRH